MPKVTIDFDLVCSECGDRLEMMDATTKAHKLGGTISVVVEPCKKCLKEAMRIGFDDFEDKYEANKIVKKEGE